MQDQDVWMQKLNSLTELLTWTSTENIIHKCINGCRVHQCIVSCYCTVYPQQCGFISALKVHGFTNTNTDSFLAKRKSHELNLTVNVSSERH